MKKDVKFYLRQLELADKEERKWRKRARKVIKVYRDEDVEGKPSHFNILWSNTATQLPAMYSATPIPDVRRRYRTEDPVGREIAKILDRALVYSMDSGASYDFDRTAQRLVLDFLLPGRMVSRVRYHPFFRKRQAEDVLDAYPEKPKGEVEQREDGTFLHSYEYDELISQEVRCYHVQWDKYRQSPATCWEDVWWVAYGDNFLTKEEIIDQFGEKHSEVPLDFNDGDLEPKEGLEDNPVKKAQVWELWDREERKVVAVVKGYDKFLMKQDDPLKLRNFFPGPEPALIVETTDSMIPIPEYCMYQFQAEELNDVSARISKLVKAMKAVGLYPGEDASKINELMQSEENILVPVDDWAAHAEKGGIKGLIDWMPIKDIADVWQRLVTQRAMIVQGIFELVGISDIQRGATDPRETRGAQQLKAQFGSKRLLPKKQRIHKFFRDILRIKAEIIAENFTPETLQKMTGLQVPEEVRQTMKDDALRSFKIDIETDSTIAPDEEREKQGVAEFLTAMGGYLGSVTPLVQANPKAAGPLGKILLWMTRKFKIARDVETEIEDFVESSTQKQGPSPADRAAEMAAKERQQELEIKQKEAEAEIARKNQAAAAENERKSFLMRAEIARKDRESEAEIARKDREAEAERRRA